MVISEFGQAREMPLVRHPELEKNPGRAAENRDKLAKHQERATLFFDKEIRPRRQLQI